MVASTAFSAPADRNKQVILEVLNPHLQKLLQPALDPCASCCVLEIASGTGQHVEHFAQAWPNITWQPSDYSAQLFDDIDARTQHLGNVAKPLVLDVCGDWPSLRVQAVLVANMFHISPLETVPGFFAGLTECLVEDGFVMTYGPYKVDGKHTSASNAEFDQSLQYRDPGWGIRDLQYIEQQANQVGLALVEQVVMPANNYCLIFEL